MNNSNRDREEKIEDVIDDRKEKGQYNIPALNESKAPCRYAYSAPVRYANEEKPVYVDICSWNLEGDVNDGRDSVVNSVGPTDSEITVLRVKMDNSFLKTAPENNWNMKDDAIPGDGTHLGESPSLVNLATLVVQSKECYEETACTYEGREYLVPLSSWDPTDKRQNSNDVEIQSDNVVFESVLNETEDSSSTLLALPQLEQEEVKLSNDYEIIKSPNKLESRNSFAGRVTKFIRKHLTKKKEYLKPDNSESGSSPHLKDKKPSNNLEQTENS